MSRSPRRNLRRALRSLEEALQVMEEHPDAKAEVVQAVGAEMVGKLESARAVLRTVVQHLGDDGGNESMTES